MRHRTVGDYIRNWVEVWPTPDNPGPNDWWMLGSEVFGEDLDHGAFLDLTRLLTADPGFALSDIPVQFRDAGSSAYAGRYTAMPLFLTTFNLLYRRDIFEQYSPVRTGHRASHNSSSMSGRQGVAGTPGSAVVMDRSTGRMGPCTREACPSAKESPDPRTGGSRLVNQVVPVDGISFGINRHAPVHRQAAAYAMLKIAPMRYSALDEKAWLNAGYNARDLKDFLAQFRTSFDADNVYYELRMPGTFQTYTLVQYLLYRYNANNYNP
ncbi:hypothetical protein HYH03_019109 [Edaphochlamys debaryana]|uniref:Uncharacterized protein n=1 Tax=Edaphochlamys debaryana TaxID=47281 RepID=A0A836BMP0_9CHLO|nr:hypothetical protein HYH03_019109 [Edaphochlamys debaryana]|eukprot:KAG2481932.1 hypothetical protein HYH03_019109 [Edaphochlamys debaryana]